MILFCDRLEVLLFCTGNIFGQLLPKEEVFSQALYTFDIGQNDLTAGYKLNMSTDQVKAYVPDLLSQLSNVIKVSISKQFILVIYLFSLRVLFIICKCRKYMRKVEDHFGFTTLDQ